MDDLPKSFSESLTMISFRKRSMTSLSSRLMAVDSPFALKKKRKKKKKEKNVDQVKTTKKYKLQSFTGLHRICFSAKGELDPLWKYALQLFEYADEDESRKIAGSQENGFIPLFLACQRQPPASVVRVLINAFPKSLYYKNESALTCLHVACKFKASNEVIRLLVDMHPNPVETIQSLSARNETPLILWMYSNDCRPPPLPVFKLLLSPKAMRISDNNGINAFQLLCDAAYQKDIASKNNQEHQENIKLLFDTFLDTKPYGTSQLMREVARFPHWLQNHVANHYQLRTILNFRISQKLTTAVLMLDFFTRILIITSFTRIMVLYSTNDTESNVWISLLILGIIYLSFKELLQLISYPFVNYITDLWNWLDALQIIMLSLCVNTFLQDGSDVNGTIITFTSSLIWITMASFLRSFYLPFSIMIMGVIHVAKVLAPFLVTTFCLLNSFSLMFFTRSVISSKETDTNCEQNSDFCTLSDTMFNTFSLFIGLEEFEQIQHDNNRISLVIFLSISSILLLNVVIAIVNNSFNDIEDEAEKLFWLNRIYFVCEIESVRNFLLEESVISKIFRKKKKIDKNYEEVYESARYLESVFDGDIPEEVRTLRVLFDILVSSLTYYEDPDERIKTEILFKHVNHGAFTWILDIPIYLRCLCAIILFPIWIVIGFLSIGWLWPPQVREFLLCSVNISNSENDVRNQTKANSFKSSRRSFIIKPEVDSDHVFKDHIRTVMQDIREMKNEISSLKANYEISKDTIDDLKTMADIMKRENMKRNLFG